jgi:MFS transporter, NNP family, nitrate/nitrite transporter
MGTRGFSDGDLSYQFHCKDYPGTFTARYRTGARNQSRPGRILFLLDRGRLCDRTVGLGRLSLLFESQNHDCDFYCRCWLRAPGNVSGEQLMDDAHRLFGLGFASGLYIPSAITTITSLIERPHWGKAVAVHELAPNLAFFAAPFVADLFLSRSTWRLALSCLAAVSLIASFAYFRFGRGGDFAGQSPASNAFGVLVRSTAFWIMAVLFGLGAGSTIGVYAMLPLYLVSERQIDPSWANAVVALSRSHGPILGVVGGWVSDRLGPKQTMVMSLTFTGVATLLVGLVSSAWISLVVLFQPLLVVWFFPAAFAVLAATTPPAARNLAVAFTIPCGYLIGGGAIPTFIGIIGDTGSFALGFVATGTIILLGGTLPWVLRLPANHAKVS